MNLEDLKNDWESLNLRDYSKLEDSDIQSIIKKRNKKNTLKAIVPEVIFMVIYLYLAIFLLIFNQQFSSHSYRVLLFVTVGILLFISGLIYSSIRLYNRNILLSESYNNSIKTLVQECKNLHQRYYIILGLSVVILISCVILIHKIYNEDPTLSQLLWSSFFGVLILGYLKFKLYVYYKRLIQNNNKFRLSLTDLND